MLTWKKIELMITVTAAILSKNNKILIARRKPDIKHAGKWEFPGGKVKPGESPEQCLIREIKEEFAIDICINEFFCESIYQYDHGRIQLLAFHVTWERGEMSPKDHDRLEWVPPDLLTAFDLLPADVPIAKKLNQKHIITKKRISATDH